MATCPKCWSEKPLIATHCPACTQRIEGTEQLGFSFAFGIIKLIAVIGFIIFIVSNN